MQKHTDSFKTTKEITLIYTEMNLTGFPIFTLIAAMTAINRHAGYIL